jgi:hypothetical protein
VDTEETDKEAVDKEKANTQVVDMEAEETPSITWYCAQNVIWQINLFNM